MKYVGLTLSLMLLFIGFASAQTDEMPYIIGRSTGDGYVQLFAIYADGHEQQLTNRPYILRDKEDVAISPDRRYLVYRVAADFFAEALANNEVGNFGDYIADLYILDLQSGESFLISGQEETVTLRSPLVRTHRVRAGHEAIWSPDSRQLVYAIQNPYCSDETGFCSRIMIYDVETNTSQLIADLPGTASPRLWTDSRIVVQNQSRSFSIYDFNGNEINRIYYNSGFVPHYVFEYEQTLYAAGGVLGFPTPDNDSWYLLDLQTGTYSRTEAFISVISVSAPDDSLLLFNYSNDTRPSAIYSMSGELLAYPPAGSPFGVDYILSPDGTQYIYDLIGQGGGDTVIGDANSETTIALDGKVMAWGARQYTLFNVEGVSITPSNDPYTSDACGSLPAVELVTGGQGRVLDGEPNRIRSAPALDAETVGNIPAGETFSVVDGQQNVCIDGIRWAQVTYDGIMGWTAEGFENETFVEPVSG